MCMKLVRLFCIAAFLLAGLAGRSEAGWHGGYCHGGGFYGGGVVFVPPGYYAPYPYYYGDPYYYPGYAVRPAFYQPPSGSVAVPVQAELVRRGYYHGPVDGVVGPGTRSAIAAYQRNHGLAVTGNINTPLLRSLRI